MNSFVRQNFFSIKNFYNSKNIIEIIKKNIINKRLNNEFQISDISSLNIVRKNSVLFLDDIINFSKYNLNNILLITDKEKIFNNYECKNIIYVNNISETWNIVINSIYSHEDSIDYSDEFTKIKNSYI